MKRRIVVGVCLVGLFLGIVGPASPAADRPTRTSDPSLFENRDSHKGRSITGEAQQPDLAARQNSAAVEVFQDPANDSGQAMDVRRVEVRNFEGQMIFFDIQTNRFEVVDELDRLLIFLDTDANRGTGDFGAEFVIDLDPDFNPQIALGRWNGSFYDFSTPQNSLAASQFEDFILIDISNTELNNTQLFNFEIVTLYPDNLSPTSFDVAPDADFWTFAFDLTPPVVKALRGKCRKPCPTGRNVNLRRRITVPEEQTREVFQILSSARSSPVDAFETDFHPADNPNDIWVTAWPAPKNPVGWHRFCVTSFDIAGNASQQDCSKISFPRIKPRGGETKVRRGVTSSGINVARLWLEKLPKNTLVTVNCKRGCKLNERRKVGGTFTSKTFSGKFLKNGTVLLVRATKPRWTGFFEKLTVGGPTGLKSATKCLAPGQRKPSKCR